MPIAMSTGYGDAPMDCAIDMPIGASSAAAAVLDINCVSPQDNINIAITIIIGDGLSPIRLTTKSAMSFPAPDLSIASASGSIPANKKIVTQSMP